MQTTTGSSYLLLRMLVSTGIELEEDGIPNKLQVRLETRHTATQAQGGRDGNIGQAVQEGKKGPGLGVFLQLRLDLL